MADRVMWQMAGLGASGAEQAQREMRETRQARYIHAAASSADKRPPRYCMLYVCGLLWGFPDEAHKIS